MPQNPPAPTTVNYTHVSNAGTVLAKSSPGYLSSLVINSASSGATLTLIDATSTTVATPVLGVVTLGAAVTVPTKIGYGDGQVAGVNLNSGLVILTTGTIDATIAAR